MKLRLTCVHIEHSGSGDENTYELQLLRLLRLPLKHRLEDELQSR